MPFESRNVLRFGKDPEDRLALANSMRPTVEIELGRGIETLENCPPEFLQNQLKTQRHSPYALVVDSGVKEVDDPQKILVLLKDQYVEVCVSLELHCASAFH